MAIITHSCLPSSEFLFGTMASNATSSLQKRLEALTRKYQDLQEELSKSVDAREKLGAQQVETESVKKVGHAWLYFV